jgi:hypothetical protein
VAATCERGAALGLARVADRPAWVVVLRARDAQTVRSARESAFAALGRRYGDALVRALPREEFRGGAVWGIGPEFALAEHGEHLVAGNSPALVRDVLTRVASTGELGLLAEPTLSEALAEGAGTAPLFAWADVERATLYERGEAAREELTTSRAAARNPGTLLVFGPALGLAPLARAITAELSFEGEDPRLRLCARDVEVPAALSASAAPASPGTEAVQLRPGARDLARATLHRDFAAVLARRTELFDADQLAALAKGLSDLSLFFMGKDLVEDVLPRVSPWWTLVARPIEFGAAPRPELELPALAAIVELSDPERDGPLVVAAFQSLVSIINVERAQQGEDALLLELALEGSTQVSFAHFLAPDRDQPVDIRYNLAPAVARNGSRVVIGSHVELVRELVREGLGGERSAGDALPARAANHATPGAVSRDALTLSGPGIARYIALNERAIVLNAMLGKGQTEARATEEARRLRLLLELVQSARIEVQRGGSVTELRVDLDLLSGPSSAAR